MAEEAKKAASKPEVPPEKPPEETAKPDEERHERMYTPTEIAREFHYSNAWINRLLRDGLLKGQKPSTSTGRWRIPASEVERMRKESIRVIVKKAKPIGKPVSELDVPENKRDKVSPPAKGKSPENKGEGKKEKMGWPLNIFFGEEEE